MYQATVYGRTFFSEDISQVKRMGSQIANDYTNAIDEMVVLSENGEYVYRRVNQKGPNNVIVRGKWR